MSCDASKYTRQEKRPKHTINTAVYNGKSLNHSFDDHGQLGGEKETRKEVAHDHGQLGEKRKEKKRQIVLTKIPSQVKNQYVGYDDVLVIPYYLP